MNAIKQCLKCNSELPITAKYCPACGVNITVEKQSNQGTKLCSFCAEEIDVDAIKCKHCGSLAQRLFSLERKHSPINTTPTNITPLSDVERKHCIDNHKNNITLTKEKRMLENISCSQCQSIVNIDQKYCHACSNALLNQQAEKSPALACFLSFLIGGLGQVYNGETGKGLVIIFMEFILFFATFGVSHIFVGVWSMIDAYEGAKRINALNASNSEVLATTKTISSQFAQREYVEQDVVWSKEKIQSELRGIFALKKSNVLSEAEYIEALNKLKDPLLRYCLEHDKYEALVLMGDLKTQELLTEEMFTFIKQKIV